MKNRLLIHIVFGAAILLVAGVSCNTSQEATTRTYKVDTADSRKIRNGLVYGLPKTQLTFRVRMKRKEVIPGPYHEYGEKLLGLSNIPHNRKVQWNIGDIDIEASSVMDYDHLYAIQPEGRFKIDWSKFIGEGWIIPFDMADRKEPDRSDFYSKKDYGSAIHFTDLSVRKFVGEETKTVYEKVWKDSLFARVPVEKTEVVQKDKPAKAREAANFIFMIREKRFELVSGMGDYYPEGEALETAVNEMNRIEENYLSLFTGKQITDTVQFTLKWTPDTLNREEPEMLFRFSQEKGILKPSQDEGAPIWIELELLDNTRRISELMRNKFAASDKPQFHYRIPVNTILRLKYGDNLMTKKYLELSQFGPVLQIPYQFLIDSQIMEFFPEGMTED